jgi:hypothetical protein
MVFFVDPYAIILDAEGMVVTLAIISYFDYTTFSLMQKTEL